MRSLYLEGGTGGIRGVSETVIRAARIFIRTGVANWTSHGQPRVGSIDLR